MKKFFIIIAFVTITFISCKKDNGVDSSVDTSTYYAYVDLNEDSNQDFPCGMIDRTGQIVIPFRNYGQIYFSEGLGCRRDHTCCYIDRYGNTAIITPGESVCPFYEGLAVVKKEYSMNSGCYVNCDYIDKTGQYVTNSHFIDAGRFSEGLASVGGTSSDDEYDIHFKIYGYIDKTGQYVIEPQFSKACCFSEGLAFVGTYTGFGGGYDYKYGIIDKTGQYICEPDNFGLLIFEAHCFSEGLAAIRTANGWGFVDKTGQIVIEPQFSHVHDFHNGLAVASDGNRYGFIDKTGQFVIPPLYHSLSDFSEGLACCSKSFYIDKTGQIVLEPHLQEVCSFSGGLAAAKEHNLWGYIDKTGQFVIEPQFSHVHDFQNIDETITDDVWR